MSSSKRIQLPPVAKNVQVFRNGDPYSGRKMVVSEKRFVTFESFLNEVTDRVQAPAAVRRIYTPSKGHRINSLVDLNNKGQYVAAGLEKFRKLDYLHTGVKPPVAPKMREIQQVGQSGSRKQEFSSPWRNDSHLPCIIHVFRNGDLMTPQFRVLLPPSMLREWDLVLNTLTQKAKLYSGAVRRLCTLDGVSLSRGADLVSGQYYVAVGSEKYKSLPYEELLTPHRDRTRVAVTCKTAKAGKIESVSQSGLSDSALTESSSQGDSRRVHAAGAEEKYQVPEHSTKEEGPLFNTKPVRVHPSHKPKARADDTNEEKQLARSIFYAREIRHELQGAEEVEEDEQTLVELPVDQRVAEIVEEENLPKNKSQKTKDAQDQRQHHRLHKNRHTKKW